MTERESYFHPGSAPAAARDMLAGLPARTRPVFRPEAAALLLLDLQRYFLDPASHAFIPSAAAIVPGLLGLAAEFRRRGRPVVWTRHGNTPAEAGRMADWWRDLLRPGSPEHALALDAGSGDLVIDKTRYDAFLGTALEAHLRSNGVDQVVIGGVAAHLCCETTARSAFMRGFHVFFLADGTADFNRAFHAAALLNLGHGFARLMMTEDIEAAFGQEENA
jgi:isochorismate hydrolase